MSPITFAGTHKTLGTLPDTPLNRALMKAENKVTLGDLYDYLGMRSQYVQQRRNVGIIRNRLNEPPSEDVVSLSYSEDSNSLSVEARVFEENGKLGSEIVTTGNDNLVGLVDGKLTESASRRLQSLFNQGLNMDSDELPKYSFKPYSP
jgi:hypothetical protein